MDPNYKAKTTFMTDVHKFCYKVMPSSLKNARATYQIMMNMIFKGQISDMQEI